MSHMTLKACFNVSDCKQQGLHLWNNLPQLRYLFPSSKVIGARYYNSKPNSQDTARDRDGHGSHTASIAAGNYVYRTSFYGFSNGTARGGVPAARIAAYAVCYPDDCQSPDVLGAFDDAIADGVDIITISLGLTEPLELESDVIAIGALHASEKGILVVQSAGNDDFSTPGTIVSVAPWIFTVAASNTDRGIISNVSLGDGTVLLVCL